MKKAGWRDFGRGPEAHKEKAGDDGRGEKRTEVDQHVRIRLADSVDGH